MRTRLRRAAAASLLALAVTASGAALTACSSPTTGSDQAASADLDAAAFGELVARDGVVVLDVRTPGEYAEGHLPGAVNIDVEAADFGARIAELDPDATYAVYCRSGNRSAVALERMREAGFTDASHLLGGIGAWTAAGGVVER